MSAKALLCCIILSGCVSSQPKPQPVYDLSQETYRVQHAVGHACEILRVLKASDIPDWCQEDERGNESPRQDSGTEEGGCCNATGCPIRY